MITTDAGKFSFKKFGAVVCFFIFILDWLILLGSMVGNYDHWTAILSLSGVSDAVIITMLTAYASFAGLAVANYTIAKIKGAA